MSVPKEDGVYWVRACSDGPWEAVLLRHGRCRTMYGERWDADETAVWGARIHEPDDEPPAPSLRERLQALVDDFDGNAAAHERWSAERWSAEARPGSVAREIHRQRAGVFRACARELAAVLETE